MSVENSGLASRQLNGLKSWLRFISSESHILRERPALLFQQAANLPESTPQAASARSRLINQQEKRPWIRWVNKPESRSNSSLTLTGHMDRIRCCATSPDGKRVLSGSLDETLRLWNAQTGAEIAVLEGHFGQLLDCAFSADGKRFVASSQDETIYLWDSETLAPLLQLRPQKEVPRRASQKPLQFKQPLIALKCAFVSPECLISAHLDESLRVWDLETGAELFQLNAGDEIERNIASLAVSPNSRWIVTIHGANLAGGEIGKNIKIWDAQSLQTVAHFQHHPRKRPTACAFSPDGLSFVTVGDKSLRVWDVRTGAQLLAKEPEDLIDPECCAYVGNAILTVFSNKVAVLLDSTSGTEIGSYSGHGASITCCAVSVASQLFVTGSNDTKLKIWVSQDEAKVERQHDGKINHVVFSPDCSTLLSASTDNTLKCWDGSTGALKNVLRVHTERTPPLGSTGVGHCAFFPGGNRIASIGKDSYLRVWDVQSGEQVEQFSFAGLSFPKFFLTADGESLVNIGANTAYVWNFRTARPETIFEGVLHSDFSTDGRFLSAIIYRHGLSVFDLRNKTTVELARFSEEAGVRYTVFSPDSSTLLYSGPSVGVVTAAPTGGAQCKRSIDPDGIRLCRFSHDSSMLLTLISNESWWDETTQSVLQREQRINLWSLPDYDFYAEIPTSQIARIVDCAFLPSASYVAVLEQGRLRIVSTHDTQDVAEFYWDSLLQCMTISLDGQQIGLGSADGDVLLLRLANFMNLQ